MSSATFRKETVGHPLPPRELAVNGGAEFAAFMYNNDVGRSVDEHRGLHRSSRCPASNHRYGGRREERRSRIGNETAAFEIDRVRERVNHDFLNDLKPIFSLSKSAEEPEE